MKTRVLAAVAVLIVGAVAWTRAQGPAAPPPTPTPGAAKPDERVAKLRAELEILQLEYDADRAFLMDAIRDQRAAELMNAQGNPNLARNVTSIALGARDDEATKAINSAVAKGQSQVEAARQHVIARERKRIEANRAYLARAKQDFARLGQALADKQAAYNEAIKGSPVPTP